MTINQKQLSIIYGMAILICFLPFISPAVALGMGLFFSILGIENKSITKYTSFSLQSSIVLMGFGMNLSQVISASKTGFADTAISVIMVMSVGILLTKLLRVDSTIGILISSGTAICGGSAIAAVSSVLNPKSYQISFSLVVIFVLNAIALIIFPAIGHYFNLSQETFGTWAAIAIHDTSSVVGTGAMYGSKALEVATTVKLIRALWIIPLSIVIALVQKDKVNGKVKIPWFIGLFAISIVIAHFIPSGKNIFEILNWLGKKGMVVALFLIGSNLSLSEVKDAGFKSFLLGVLLWLFIGVTSFIALTTHL